MPKSLSLFAWRALETCLSLLVPLLMLAAAAVWSGELLGLPIQSAGDAPETEAKVPQPTTAELQQMGLTDVSLQVRDSVSWFVRTAEGTPCGRIIGSHLASHKVTGYAGPVPVYVYVSADNRIVRVVPAENAETASFFSHAAEQLLPRWEGKPVQEALTMQVDAVTGATFSSNALNANIREALAADAATQTMDTGSATPTGGWGKALAALGVVLLGILAAWRYRGVKWLRLLVLIANVGVVGFWCGHFLSLTLLLGWAQHGGSALAYLPVLVIFICSLVLPLFGLRGHYCTWICPYGSLQELVWRLPVPKLAVSPATWRRLRMVRRLIFGLLFLSLWSGLGAFLLDYEPFAAFRPANAASAVMVLAGAFILLGLFVPRPWCKCCCPLGEWLDLCAPPAGSKRSQS